jgi:uncharacterized membrane protein (DUF4010 family)
LSKTCGGWQLFDPGINTALIGLGIATAVGFIVGLEREWEDKPIGLRSFVLIAVLGGLASLLRLEIGDWIVPAALLALAVVLSGTLRRDDQHHARGLTTLISALVVFLLGAAAVAGFWLHCLVLAGVVTLLLHWKAPLHGWVDRLGRDDFEIITRFVLIALVILPLLPDRTFGPYDVFNPFEAWLLVVLIVSLNLAGYLALRFFGADAGTWMAGLFGGLISSTATTVSYAGISKRDTSLSAVAALVILIASTVVYGRVLFEVSVVAPDLLRTISAPLVIYTVFMLGLCLSMHLFSRDRRALDTRTYGSSNPARIRSALTFAALYVAILFVVEFTRDNLGSDAIYLVAAVSGLTDVDALTLSTAALFSKGKLDADTAWRAIFLASLSNLIFKGVVAWVLGSAELRKWISAAVSVSLFVGFCLLYFWP